MTPGVSPVLTGSEEARSCSSDLFIDHGAIARCRLPQAAPKALYPDTTSIYAEIDLDMKAKAMALCDAAEL